MLKKKHADAKTEILLGLVMAIIVILTLMFFLKPLFDAGRESMDREGCLSSVRAAALSNPKQVLLPNMKGRTRHEIADLNCPIEEYSYTDADVGEQKDLGVKKAIAQQMYSCYYKMDRGRSDFLPNFEKGTAGKEKLNYCVICSVLDFSAVSTDNAQVTGLLSYLNENNIIDDPSITDPNIKMTYWEYLTDEYPLKQGDEGYDVISSESDALPTDEKLAVVFVLSKYEDPWDKYYFMGLYGASAYMITVPVAGGISAVTKLVGSIIPIPGVGAISGTISSGARLLPVAAVFVGGIMGYQESRNYRSQGEADLGEMTENSEAVYPTNAGVMVIPFRAESMVKLCNYLGDIPDDEAFKRAILLEENTGEGEFLDPNLPGKVLQG